jgi:hypothetical protein
MHAASASPNSSIVLAVASTQRPLPRRRASSTTSLKASTWRPSATSPASRSSLQGLAHVQTCALTLDQSYALHELEAPSRLRS